MERPIDKDTLYAFMDGELDPAAMPAIEDAITEDESTRATIIDSVITGARLRSTLNQTLEEQVPERLTAALAPRTGKRNRFKPVLAAIIGLAAAFVILISGFLAGKGFLPGNDKLLPALSADLPAPYRQVIDEALEHNLSGTPRQWQPPQDSITVTVTPVRTYRHKDGRYYREYRLEVNGGDQPVRINGLAYRADPGRWTTRAIFF
jgi:hypothetical protein